MKKITFKLFLIVIVALSAIACKNDSETVTTTAAQDVAQENETAQMFTVDTNESIINWLGSKPTSDHYGTMKLQSGSLGIADGTIVSGEFLIDMHSIVVTDIEGEGAQKLANHLMGTVEGTEDHFFNANTYPNSKFIITNVEKDESGALNVYGNLTLKNITLNINFLASLEIKNDQVFFTSQTFTIDRTDWGVKYGSQKFSDKILDSAISDDIELKVSLVARK